MAKKDEQGPIQLVRGYVTRFAEYGETLTELKKEGEHFQQNVQKQLEQMECLRHQIASADEEIARLQADRDSLYHKYLSAQFESRTDDMQSIQSERASLD